MSEGGYGMVALIQIQNDLLAQRLTQVQPETDLPADQIDSELGMTPVHMVTMSGWRFYTIQSLIHMQSVGRAQVLVRCKAGAEPGVLTQQSAGSVRREWMQLRNREPFRASDGRASGSRERLVQSHFGFVGTAIPHAVVIPQ